MHASWAIYKPKWTVKEHQCEGGYLVSALHAISIHFIFFLLLPPLACVWVCVCMFMLNSESDENQSFVGRLSKTHEFYFLFKYYLLAIFIIIFIVDSYESNCGCICVCVLDVFILDVRCVLVSIEKTKTKTNTKQKDVLCSKRAE